MSKLQRRIYSVLLRLHPAAFRRQFARDMARDCEDAIRDRGFAALVGDAFLSLARQWRSRALAGPEPAPAMESVAGHPFLSGQYVVVTQGSSLTAFDLASASIVSLLLLLTIGYAASMPNRRAIADLQSVTVNHDGGINTGGNDAPSAIGHARSERPGSGIPLAATGYGGTPFHGRVVLGPARPGVGLGVRAKGGPLAVPRSLTEALLQLVMISAIIWLTALFFRRCVGVGRKTALATLGLLAIAASVAFGQAPAVPGVLRASGPVPQFDVATVKPNDPNVRFMVTPPGSQQTVHAASTTRGLVANAYELSPMTRVVGGPDWMGKDIYRIESKIPDDAYAAMQKMTNDERHNQTMLMMQSLLAERFKLKVHVETRDLPVWQLTVAKGGTKLPPQNDAQPPAGADDASRARSMAGGEAVGPAGVRIRNMALDGMLTAPWFGLNDRPIVNATGLTGKYNLDLNWIPDIPRQAANPNGPPPVPEGQASIFTVLEEQFGLKLVNAKAPVEVVVIDAVERPSEN
jgi:uncharacterized protein (TIGR03435 family)